MNPFTRVYARNTLTYPRSNKPSIFHCSILDPKQIGYLGDHNGESSCCRVTTNESVREEERDKPQLQETHDYLKGPQKSM